MFNKIGKNELRGIINKVKIKCFILRLEGLNEKKTCLILDKFWVDNFNQIFNAEVSQRFFAYAYTVDFKKEILKNIVK